MLYVLFHAVAIAHDDAWCACISHSRPLVATLRTRQRSRRREGETFFPILSHMQTRHKVYLFGFDGIPLPPIRPVPLIIPNVGPRQLGLLLPDKLVFLLPNHR